MNSILAGTAPSTNLSISTSTSSNDSETEHPPPGVTAASTIAGANIAASLVSAGGGSAAESKLVHQAITTQKSETPFGDLVDLDGGMAVSLQERRWAGDWVDFDEDGEGEEEGEDVPITMAVDFGRRGRDEKKEGEEGGKEKEDGSSEEGSGTNSSDEEGARVGLTEARRRSLLEDEED